MRWILQYLKDSSKVDLQIVVTGMHLSPEFGLTYKVIEQDGFTINKKVELLLSADTPSAISKSMGLGMISFADAFIDLNPDLLVVLGDRFEIFAAVASAISYRIPVAHIHGGETTEGAIDESFRHAITKMSHIHFTANEEYRKRVIQLGEKPFSVFNAGSPGLDNLTKLQLLDKAELESELGFLLGNHSILVTYHPATLEEDTDGKQLNELLESLDYLEGWKIIFTLPNADTHGRVLIERITNYVRINQDKAAVFTSLGQVRYLSLLKYVSLVIGNSSSGLTEVPSFHIPTINIGDRQGGRMRAMSVIDCHPESASISAAIDLALSTEFQKTLPLVDNPYGQPGASEKIASILMDFPLDNLLKKEFYNLESNIF
jgi:GDP/UDP-N,N'-diacetylbacillosamine 2-epimerase (hydrolysing)